MKTQRDAGRRSSRVCRGGPACATGTMNGRGSSPRVRGTLAADGGSGEFDRIIPACAGDAGQGSIRPCSTADHPRVCGGRDVCVDLATRRYGSSPRVRGTRRGGDAFRPRFRIIPACAGDASRSASHSIMSTDHPRVCGGRETNRDGRDIRNGSSPRVRGTRPGGTVRARQDRIIPACAGDAPTGTARWPRIADHPRVCGGRNLDGTYEKTEHGSSPRVRGTRARNPRSEQSPRIIPACAGDATSRRFRPAHRSDHPRVCGGRQRGLIVRTENRRIIPACAGDASRSTPSMAADTDHPRVCGGRGS